MTKFIALVALVAAMSFGTSIASAAQYATSETTVSSAPSGSLTQVGPTLSPANAKVETQLMLRHNQSVQKFLGLIATSAVNIEVTSARRFKCHIGHDNRCMFNTGMNSAGKIIQTDFRQGQWRWAYRVTFTYTRIDIVVTRVVTFHELSSNLLSGAKRVKMKHRIVTRRDIKINAVIPRLALVCVGSVAKATASIKIIRVKVSAKNKGFKKLKVLVAKYSVVKTIVCGGVPSCAAGQIMVGGNCVVQSITQECKTGEIRDSNGVCVAINNNCGVVIVGDGNTVNTGDICSMEVCVNKGGNWTYNGTNQTYVCSFPPPPPPAKPACSYMVNPEHVYPGMSRWIDLSCNAATFNVSVDNANEWRGFVNFYETSTLPEGKVKWRFKYTAANPWSGDLDSGNFTPVAEDGTKGVLVPVSTQTPVDDF